MSLTPSEHPKSRTDPFLSILMLETKIGRGEVAHLGLTIVI
jgi:hypothetical protein